MTSSDEHIIFVPEKESKESKESTDNFSILFNFTSVSLMSNFSTWTNSSKDSFIYVLGSLKLLYY